MDPLHHFREIWLLDFEFHQPPGERPAPLCLVAREHRTRQTIRVWADDLAYMADPPFPVGADALMVAYYASAELGCFLALGWPMPARVLDLFTEFRCLTNGRPVPCGNGLLGALAYYGLPAIESAAKDSLRELAQRGGRYSESERQALVEYCETDVLALAKLLPTMLPSIDVPRALLRGRYMAAAARMEWNGVPIDAELLETLRDNWERIRTQLIREIDSDYGVFVPTGQRPINPESRLGSAILETAEKWNIDTHALSEAAGEVWSDHREITRETVAAVEAARKATGLSKHRIDRWEDSGRDYSSYAGLDVIARELAGEHRELGIGPGYQEEGGYDDTDYAGLLWGRLRDADDKLKPKHDPDILAEAAEMVADAGDDWRAGRSLSFNARKFGEWLETKEIPWPRLASGVLNLSDDAFRQTARIHPEVAPLRELRHSLGEMRLFNLAVGADGRNRCLLSAFRSVTGRNQPSNVRFIFGPSTWVRSLIRPEPGQAVAYVDWSQQEFGIAAALSGDSAMMEAYRSGDPYLTFAKQVGAVPTDATKESHPQERERFKVCVLAVQYGMSSRTLAQNLGGPEALARELLRLHRQTYPTFWRWSQAAVDHAMLHGWLQTVFGWRIHVGPKVNPRSLANFPMQANGAEMLRLACCLATERGVEVCAPVHDALLVEGSARHIQQVVAQTQKAMAEASRVVLEGFELRTDTYVVEWPGRYADDRGIQMWDTINKILAEQPRSECATSV